MRQQLLLVNASHILTDQAVQDMVEPLQTQFDRDFIPAWGSRAISCEIGFAGISDIPDIPSDVWCIFLNKHSLEADALGWHEQGQRVYARVFVGDCIRLGLDYQVTVSHEALEMSLDPDIKRAWKMPDGRLASVEACDAVESDDQSYRIGKMRVSNFVLPRYFSTHSTGPYDFRKVLDGPCPALSPGGYMILSARPGGGGWTQIFANKADGIPGRRALFKGHRRMVRPPPEAMEVSA